MSNLRVREVDETELIRRFRAVLGPGPRTRLGSGDDCALISAPEGAFLVTTDVLVQGRHFRADWSTAFEIGERAAAQNLADIAAMGGRTSSLVVSLVVPGDTEVDWLVDLAAGMGARAEAAGAEVVGGDLSGGSELSVSVTALGYCEGPVVTRAMAQPGDVVAVAGTLGRSAAGLELLMRGLVDADSRDGVVPEGCAEPLAVYRAPRPPLEAGPVAARAGAHAMLDVSDGLLIDGGRIAKASNVVVEIDSSLLEADCAALSGAAAVCGHDAWEWVLAGGEDHSLLATFPSTAALPGEFRPIGTVSASGPGVRPGLLVDGEARTGGWDHFA